MSASQVVAVEINAPAIEYGQLTPMLIVFGAAIVGVLVEAFAPRAWRYAVHVPLALLSLVVAFVGVVLLAGTENAALGGSIIVDGPTLFIQGSVLLVSIFAVLLMAERGLDVGPGGFIGQAAAPPGTPAEREAATSGVIQTEVFPLALFSIGGMMLFPAAGDLLTMFVALEVLSLPLYLLCGLARRRRLLSQEAALKYFLLGAFSSAFFLYGIALIYGFAGTVRISAIAEATAGSEGNDALLLIGTGLLAVGLLFKIGSAPFHAWIPDVYEGAPTPVTGFMAAATKVAAFGALLRVFYVALGGLRWDWRPLFWGIAILTMLIGALIAITQTDVKRMLAYSSVAHVGFLLTGVIATSQAGLSSTMFYLLAYAFITLGAFAVVTLVRDASGEATHLSRWAGLGRRSPLVAGVFALFLLALAGIPLTSGFTGKFAVFQAAIAGGALPLVIVGVVSSAIAAFFYVRVIVLMFFSEPGPGGPTVAVPSAFTTMTIAVGAAVTLLLGVLPQPVLDLAGQAAVFVP